jgi:predicted lipid-binding transport protein (Tim44 family)
MKISQRIVGTWTSPLAMAAVAVGLALAMVAQDVEAARRLGGGKSFGRQSQNVERQQMQPPAGQPAQAGPVQQAGQPAAAGAAAQPKATGSRWAGPLAGLAAGLGIAALLSAFGLTGAFAEMLGSLLVIALLVFAGLFVWRMLRPARGPTATQRRMEPAFEAPGADAARRGYAPSAAARPGSVAATLGTARAAPATAAVSSAPWGVPADFDVEAFLRNAKVHFIRLQAAWDANNLDDIREFTTPEVFAEIRMQLSETAGARAQTDVVSLDAQLLGIEEGASDYVASVRFDGSTREGQSGVERFSEVWNLSKPKRGNRGWLLAGIQQLQ